MVEMKIIASFFLMCFLIFIPFILILRQKASFGPQTGSGTKCQSIKSIQPVPQTEIGRPGFQMPDQSLLTVVPQGISTMLPLALLQRKDYMCLWLGWWTLESELLVKWRLIHNWFHDL